MRIGSLFSGAGMLDLAVALAMDAELAWVSDIKSHASAVLAHHHPDVPNLGDITAVDWARVERVEIICGGSPCQDLSTAGRLAGMTEGTRSNLWVVMREAIATIRPTYVIWENVRGANSACAQSASDSVLGLCPRCVDPDSDAGHAPNLRALGRVLGDLTDLGYDTQWRGLRASDGGGVPSPVPILRHRPCCRHRPGRTSREAVTPTAAPGISCSSRTSPPICSRRHEPRMRTVPDCMAPDHQICGRR